VLRSAENDPDTYVMVCACQEETQKKLFQKALASADFDPEHLISVDIRNSANDGILYRIQERLNELAGPALTEPRENCPASAHRSAARLPFHHLLPPLDAEERA
jgi:hypothetical protein